MNTVRAEPSDADAPTPQDGVEQAAADQAARQQRPMPAKSDVIDTVSRVGDGVTDVADIIFPILQ
jgi:hypothetical protein